MRKTQMYRGLPDPPVKRPAKDKPLTQTQRYDLGALEKSNDSYQRGWGCTNMTMAALERRGLVTFRWDNPLESSFGHWEITEAGRQFLAAT